MPAKEVADLIAMKRALAKFTPDIAKEMNTEIRESLMAIQKTARALVPERISLRNFMDDNKPHVSRTSKTDPFPRYNAATVRKGIVMRMGKTKTFSSGYVGFYSIINKSRAGAIVETAGRGIDRKPSKSNNPKARDQFMMAVANDTGGKLFEYGHGPQQRGRIIFRAAVEDNGKTKKAIYNATQKALAAFKNQLGKAA